MSVSTHPSVEVALATFNSERFLCELLESLFCQSHQGFTVLISDDGSSDSTLDIVAEFIGKYPGRIKTLEFDRRAGGARANFSRLIDHLTADYILFCDHDDVWLPNKIELSLGRMQKTEMQYGTDIPILVHTDLTVVGPALEVLHPSAWRYQNIDPTRDSLRTLLLANTATGCASMANRALYERARPVPDGALMHDYWFALVAAIFGKIEIIRESSVLYRQHSANTIGASAWNGTSVFDRIYRTLFGVAKKRMLKFLSGQASALLNQYGSMMTPEQYRTTETLAKLWSTRRMYRFVRLLRNGILLKGVIRNIGLFIVVSRKDCDEH